MGRGGDVSRYPAAIRGLVDLVAGATSGMTRDELAAALNGVGAKRQDPQRVAVAIARAISVGALVETVSDTGVRRLFLPMNAEPARSAVQEGLGGGTAGDVAIKREGPVRAVIIDVESVVRTTAAEPYTDRRIYQVGALRTGTDAEWIAERPVFNRYLALPDGTWEIHSEQVGARHRAEYVPPAQALDELREFCHGGQFIVAHNGHEADFRMLDEAYARAAMPTLDITAADAYYLLLAVWPGASSHRLAKLADDVGVEHSDLQWHDALADCHLLDRLLRHAAATVAAWEDDLVDLVASVCPDSSAWYLIRHLAGEVRATPSVRAVGRTQHLGHPQISRVLDACLREHEPRRVNGRSSAARASLAPLSVADSLRGPDGRVSPSKLAQLVRGSEARPRPAQEQMTSALHAWIDAGSPALVEAPTGTGKSLAILAAVLDWLAEKPTHTAVISTFTKQLQAQLADDLKSLDTAVPGLLRCGDVVKGAANRLSLRALAVVLSDATVEAAGTGRAPGRVSRFLRDVRFRELAVYMLLRLAVSRSTTEQWVAHSVDPVDLPPFFSGYCGPVLPVWLTTLSQAGNGDYAAGSTIPSAAHTDFVKEALTTHRLLLANHALLLSHLGDLEALGPETLLIVDEAHQLEDAATSALTTSLDYRAIEDLHGDLGGWLETARPGGARDEVREALSNLSTLLDHEQLPKLASRVFDVRCAGSGAQIGSRTATLASAYVGVAGTAHVRSLTARLIRLQGVLESVVGTLATYETRLPRGVDSYESERVKALLARSRLMRDSTQLLAADLNALLRGAGATANRADEEASGVTGGESEELRSWSEDEEADKADGRQLAEAEASRSELDSAPEADRLSPPTDPSASDEAESSGDHTFWLRGPLPEGTSNRVVFAEELAELRSSGKLRHYRFRIASSPVELPEDGNWRQFLSTFIRTYYVSATLRVAGDWQFIRDRLGLPPSIERITLPSPFELGEQCHLVCFSDFPSWAEQAEGAMRTVAHQLAGYAREIIRPRPVSRGDADDSVHWRDDLGYDGGALVLTTARSTAGGIADLLANTLRAAGDETPVRCALTLGNRRAFDEFVETESGGGILVGTKGLWQGIDVADDRRLRLVWINKLPFAPFAAPVVEARRAAVATRADAAHAGDPDEVATETYYLPLAALQLQQAVGRLIRSERHSGVVVISDRKLAGSTALRRAYRRVFLGSLDPRLLVGEHGSGNVVTMQDGWRRIWTHLAERGVLGADRLADLVTDKELERHVHLPQTLRIRELEMTLKEVDEHRREGTLAHEVVRRARIIGGLLHLSDEAARLKPAQEDVIRAVAEERDVLGLLPTGFGKSFCFQLPALVLPGITIVASPLVALMHDQALELNRSIGGAVRALVAPMRESSSRTGKTEVADQLVGRHDHGIRIVYVSPERLCQRRFQEILRTAVTEGRVTRIALDEAHTFVQWDDFRPAMSRVEQFLAELRRDHGLRVTALTATANRTVLAGLREGVFRRPGDVVGGVAGERAEAAAGGLVTVRENPIRPELAIFRRSLSRGGPVQVARLAQEVLDTLDDHGIFYCLTVREVVALHASLSEYLGAAGTRVLRFHGRLSEAEKAAVMTEFREAPSKGDEDFAPLVVVATAAFGLGINRPDIRTVFCVSAPTDLAALYQQIGRAGRDAAGREEQAAIAEAPKPEKRATAPANVGLALGTPRALRTVRFMTCRDLSRALLRRMAKQVLACDGVLDPAKCADELIAEGLAAGTLSPTDAQSARTADEYRAGVMRALATLAELGAVEDLGDFPPLCAVKPGEAAEATENGVLSATAVDEEPDQGVVEDAVVQTVLKLPARDALPGQLTLRRLDVSRLDEYLARRVSHYRRFADCPAATWQLLAELHDQGRLDVSAAPSRGFVTGVRALVGDVPSGYEAAVSGKVDRAREELRLLRGFFDDERACANQKFADYFDVEALPSECCQHDGNRCDACWHRQTWPSGQHPPNVVAALDTPVSKLTVRRADTEARLRRLDDRISRLVWEVHSGVHHADLYRALRGEDSRFVPSTRRRVPLRSGLIASRYFGSEPAARLQDVEESLARLAERGTVVRTGNLWRHEGHLRRERKARERLEAAALSGGEGAS